MVHCSLLSSNFIANLVSGNYSEGKYTINWNGLNNMHQEVSSGIYIYQLKYNEGIISKKMILLR